MCPGGSIGEGMHSGSRPSVLPRYTEGRKEPLNEPIDGVTNSHRLNSLSFKEYLAPRRHSEYKYLEN